jgi:hypothetical protein
MSVRRGEPPAAMRWLYLLALVLVLLSSSAGDGAYACSDGATAARARGAGVVSWRTQVPWAPPGGRRAPPSPLHCRSPGAAAATGAARAAAAWGALPAAATPCGLLSAAGGGPAACLAALAVALCWWRTRDVAPALPAGGCAAGAAHTRRQPRHGVCVGAPLRASEALRAAAGWMLPALLVAAALHGAEAAACACNPSGTNGSCTYTASCDMTIPAGGVPPLSFVCVGAGGNGYEQDPSASYGFAGGGGGALAYRNGVLVAPGDVLSVVVGAPAACGITDSTTCTGTAGIHGGPSSVAAGGSYLLYAGGGLSPTTATSAVGAAGGCPTLYGTSVGFCGGAGGSFAGSQPSTGASGGSAGGGAGGYAGTGGVGGNSAANASSASITAGTAGVGGGGGGGGGGFAACYNCGYSPSPYVVRAPCRAAPSRAPR